MMKPWKFLFRSVFVFVFVCLFVCFFFSQKDKFLSGYIWKTYGHAYTLVLATGVPPMDQTGAYKKD